MRLTAELIERSPQFENPCREREIDMRGQRIPAIENLGLLQDLFDVIDLSDNEIISLENFPRMNRLNTIMLNNNRIRKIEEGISQNVPNLECLILTNNHLGNVTDLEKLRQFSSSLTHLSLMNNPITRLPDYRLLVIYMFPKLTLLDFQRVKLHERKAAKAKFGALESGKSKTFTPGVSSDTETPASMRLTAEDVSRIQSAIAAATSLDEIARLEGMLREGRVPSNAV